MGKATKEARKKFDELYQMLQEAEQAVKAAEEEEAKKLERVGKAIESLCEREGVFCGAILTRSDLTNVINLALKTKEDVKIKFNLYINED